MCVCGGGLCVRETCECVCEADLCVCVCVCMEYQVRQKESANCV